MANAIAFQMPNRRAVQAITVTPMQTDRMEAAEKPNKKSPDRYTAKFNMQNRTGLNGTVAKLV